MLVIGQILFCLSYLNNFLQIGLDNGAAIRLERWLDRETLFLPCRHHIYEVILSAVFELFEGKTTSPNISVFDVLVTNWSKFHLTNLKSMKDITRIQDNMFFDFQEFHTFCLTILQVS